MTIDKSHGDRRDDNQDGGHDGGHDCDHDKGHGGLEDDSEAVLHADRTHCGPWETLRAPEDSRIVECKILYSKVID